MKQNKEICNCSVCHGETSHAVVLVRKESEFKGQPNRTRKEFVAGLIKGWLLGAFIASMDEFSRHLICEQCGHKTIED